MEIHRMFPMIVPAAVLLAACGEIREPDGPCDPAGESCALADAGPGGEACEPGEPAFCIDSSRVALCGEHAGTEESQSCEFGCDRSAGRCNACAPGTATCQGGELETCGASGQVTSTVSCPFGCAPTGERCLDVVPSNGLAPFLSQTAGAPEVTGVERIDTDEGVMLDGRGEALDVPTALLPAPPGGVPVRVFMVRSLVYAGGPVSGEPALAIVSGGEIRLEGNMRVGAGAMPAHAPCAGNPGEVDPAPGDAALPAGGGGGASFGEEGGRGADQGDDGFPGGGTPGIVSGSESLEPLRGGCPGGAGGSETGEGFAGGRGGGAVQLVSRTRIELAGASLGAPGYGGKGDFYDTARPGGGGGSGGGILLEAPVVLFADGAAVAANGGAGCVPGENSVVGVRGGVGVEPARPCPGAGQGGALGGAAGDAADDSGGGGGGGVGRIRINTLEGALDAPAGTVFSPSPSVGVLELR